MSRFEVLYQNHGTLLLQKYNNRTSYFTFGTKSKITHILILLSVNKTTLQKAKPN